MCSGTGGSENNESIQLNSNDTTEIENLDVKTLIKNCTLHATCEPPATAGSKNIPHLYSEGNTTATSDTPSESNNDRLVHGTPLQQNHGMDTQNNAAMELNQPQQPPTISDLLAFMKQSQQQIQMENRQNQEKKEQQLQIVTGNQKQTQGEIMSQLKEHKQKLDGIADIPAQLQLQQQQQDEFQEIVMKQVQTVQKQVQESDERQQQRQEIFKAELHDYQDRPHPELRKDVDQTVVVLKTKQDELGQEQAKISQQLRDHDGQVRCQLKHHKEYCQAQLQDTHGKSETQLRETEKSIREDFYQHMEHSHTLQPLQFAEHQLITPVILNHGQLQQSGGGPGSTQTAESTQPILGTVGATATNTLKITLPHFHGKDIDLNCTDNYDDDARK